MKTSDIQKKILPILKRQGVIKAAIFGSFARGEENKNSDVDLLLEIAKHKTFFDLLEMKLELEDRLGRKVDIVEYNAINPLIRKEILREQKKIYEKKS